MLTGSRYFQWSLLNKNNNSDMAQIRYYRFMITFIYLGIWVALNFLPHKLEKRLFLLLFKLTLVLAESGMTCT